MSAAGAAPGGRPARVLLAKPGLDGHDRGIKVIGMALRDAGAEVIYLGLRRSVTEIVAAARDEDADVIGISVLSGAHLALTRALLAERDAAGLTDIPVTVGGTIGATDAATLRELGVAAVHGVGTPLPEVVATVLGLAAATRELAAATRAAVAG
ncbi:cobalamin B12-binding domain-containing protein [Parafrankia sp. EUN1f]|uniref:cobalamin B12-binding domain-containing protein n=1 Tax=Parafrankia sp. EUN1f TaxID=102897 RepID=UPI0001C43F2B|nr:cobalamin-dependent protein [Parafrankia sp. EUN1f]EFC82997.1 cobalamin B12-binding domain protein [Parafrankia sp. EUN1f]